jgi:hypothetical protein
MDQPTVPVIWRDLRYEFVGPVAVSEAAYTM